MCANYSWAWGLPLELVDMPSEGSWRNLDFLFSPFPIIIIRIIFFFFMIITIILVVLRIQKVVHISELHLKPIVGYYNFHYISLQLLYCVCMCGRGSEVNLQALVLLFYLVGSLGWNLVCHVWGRGKGAFTHQAAQPSLLSLLFP